jgi:putative radical SAM enzyme (TIGR03279 family)
MTNKYKGLIDKGLKILDNTNMAKIINILEESMLLDQVCIGEDVVSFNGRPFEDILDYIFADSLETVRLEVIDSNGEKREVDAYKESDYYTLGLEFDDSIEIKAKECHNNCIFCFVEQLPKNLRETLYIKDDDYRLSFISGSYITCTNLQEKDIERILSYKLSPLYISVHATDDDIQKYMFGVKNCKNQLDTINRLTGGGILLHAQIVLVGGVNDKAVLTKTLNDLWDANVATVAIVPVGLTSFRKDLHEISPISKNLAQETIKQVEEFNKEHEFFAYCSDEMYQIAETDLPSYEYYNGFEQIENGVGLIVKFLYELEESLSYAPRSCIRKVGIFTGVSGKSTMEKAKQMIENKWGTVEVNIYSVENTFFGETVTVTGLVTATDIIKSYGTNNFEEDYLIIPSVMLKEFETVFLDNKSVDDLSVALKKKIIVSRTSGDDLVNAILDGEDI